MVNGCRLRRLLALLLVTEVRALQRWHVEAEPASLQVQAGAKGRRESLWRSASDRIDLLGALADDPPGSFAQLLGPVSQAVSISYNASSGEEYQPELANNTIAAEHAAGEVWERLFDLEADPERGGVHATVFASHGARRVIVAYRGMCMDRSLEQCRADECYGLAVHGFGDASAMMYRTSPQQCEQFEGRLDYAEQAEAILRRVQERYPSYRVLLVGHSLGGFLASVTAARQPGVLQALTFAPTPFHYALSELYGLAEEALDALHADLVSTCDRYDCGFSSAYVADARQGSTTCLYLDAPEPPLCDAMHIAPYGSDPEWRDELLADRVRGGMCKSLVHEWSRYEGLVLATNADGSPAHKPSCSLDFSV